MSNQYKTYDHTSTNKEDTL